MAQIIYEIVTGSPDFTASILPAESAPQVHNSLGVYSFDGLPDQSYILTVVDANGCSDVHIICGLSAVLLDEFPFTTTTSTTEFICNNIILNDGFEDWTDGAPDNWINFGGVQENTIVHSGNYSVLLSGTTGVYQTVESINTCLTLDLWYNTESDNCATYSIIRSSDFAYLQEDGSWSGDVYTFILDNTSGQWINNSLFFNTDIGTSYLIILQSNECIVYYDDVRVCDSCINPPTTTTTTTDPFATTTTTTTDCGSEGYYGYGISLYNCNDCTPNGGGTVGNSEPLTVGKWYYHPEQKLKMIVDSFIGCGYTPIDPPILDSTKKDTCEEVECPTTTTTTTSP